MPMQLSPALSLYPLFILWYNHRIYYDSYPFFYMAFFTSPAPWAFWSALLCTLIRIPLALACVILIKYGLKTPAGTMIILALLSDMADGWIARRYGVSSALGAILDPITDKIFIGTVFIALWWYNHLPFFLMTLILSRDILILIGGLFMKAYGYRLPSVNWVSKVNTCLQCMVGLASLLSWHANFLTGIMTITTLASIILYARQAYTQFKHLP